MTQESQPASLLKLERQSVLAKLWTTFALILMGGIMLPPYNNVWLRFAAMRLIEMVEVFVLSALIFV